MSTASLDVEVTAYRVKKEFADFTAEFHHDLLDLIPDYVEVRVMVDEARKTVKVFHARTEDVLKKRILYGAGISWVTFHQSRGEIIEATQELVAWVEEVSSVISCQLLKFSAVN